MSKYNHIKSIPIDSIPKEEIYTAIKEWAEGDESMERFLIACYEKGIKTTGCHAGARPYIGFKYENNSYDLSGILSTTINIPGARIHMRVDGGNPFSGPDWDEPSITIGFDEIYQDEADQQLDELTSVVEQNISNEEWLSLINLMDFFLNKESGLSFRLIHTQNGEYIFRIESSAICEERYKYYNDLFSSLGMNEYREGIPKDSKRREWEINSNSFSEIKEKIKVFSKEIINRYDLKPEVEEENMVSFITLARYKKKNLSPEQFEEWLQAESDKLDREMHRARMIKRTVDTLSKLVEIPEEKKEEMIDRLIKLNDQETIKDLSQAAYRVLGNDQELYDYALNVIRNINPSICPPVEEMKKKLSSMFANEVEGNMSLEENHKLVDEELVKFTELFNKNGIDYYIVGALPCFIKTGQPLFRYHDDIDIMVNEEDIPRVASIIESSGYKFQDDRFPTLQRYKEMEVEAPPHTVLAQHPDNEFHLGFFTFRREPNKSITMREYSHRIENDEVVVDVLERKSDPIGTSLRYDETPTGYKDTEFRTCSIESTYSLKNYTKRPKDITDMKKLEPYVDQTKLSQIKEHPNTNVETKNITKNNNKQMTLTTNTPKQGE